MIFKKSSLDLKNEMFHGHFTCNSINECAILNWRSIKILVKKGKISKIPASDSKLYSSQYLFQVKPVHLFHLFSWQHFEFVYSNVSICVYSCIGISTQDGDENNGFCKTNAQAKYEAKCWTNVYEKQANCNGRRSFLPK